MIDKFSLILVTIIAVLMLVLLFLIILLCIYQVFSEIKQYFFLKENKK